MNIHTSHYYYTIVPCKLGHLLVVGTQDGLCRIALADTIAQLEELVRAKHKAAVRDAQHAQLTLWCAQLLDYIAADKAELSLPLAITGTPFQQQVWSALLAIPYGETRSYSDIAQAIGRPKAYRAVAQACGQNPVALVVPCHRIIGSNNSISGYRWGVERKKILLEQERRAVVNYSK